jgi:hypothetical protein
VGYLIDSGLPPLGRMALADRERSRRIGRTAQILREGDLIDAEIETRASRPVGDF